MMLKEEKWMFRCIGALTAKENHKVLRKAFREAVRAVREDCAKVAEAAAEATRDYNVNQCVIKISAAIRSKGKK